MLDQAKNHAFMKKNSLTPSRKWPSLTVIVFMILFAGIFGVIYKIGSAAEGDPLHFSAPTTTGQSSLPGNRPLQPGAQSGTGYADAPWATEREEGLMEQRRMAEMMPNTPGVTPDQYVGEGDDSSFAKDEAESGK